MANIITSHGISDHDEMHKALAMRGIPANAEKDRVLRVSPDKKVVATATKTVTNLVAAKLQERLNRYKLADEQLSSLLAPSRDVLKQDKQGAVRIAALRKAQEAAADGMNGQRQKAHDTSSAKRRPMEQAFMSLHPGVNVLAPPWDMNFFNPNPPNFPFEFANGSVFSETGLFVGTRDSYNGQIVGNGGSGTASAGFGFFVSSPVDRTAAFRPFMPYSYSWDDDSTWGYTAHNSGGPGFIVYEAGASFEGDFLATLE